MVYLGIAFFFAAQFHSNCSLVIRTLYEQYSATDTHVQTLIMYLTVKLHTLEEKLDFVTIIQSLERADFGVHLVGGISITWSIAVKAGSLIVSGFFLLYSFHQKQAT